MIEDASLKKFSTMVKKNGVKWSKVEIFIIN